MRYLQRMTFERTSVPIGISGESTPRNTRSLSVVSRGFSVFLLLLALFSLPKAIKQSFSVSSLNFVNLGGMGNQLPPENMNLQKKFALPIAVDSAPQRLYVPHSRKVVKIKSNPEREFRQRIGFRYGNFAANTTAATEGDLPTGLTLQSATISGTVSQYSDYISLSDLLVDVTIDPIVSNAAGVLGYRLGLSVDTIVRTELESVNSSVDEDPVGSYLSASDFRRARALLAGADVQPKDNGYFAAIAHPYAVYDLVNDATAGGFIEMHKFTRPESLDTMQDRGLVGRIGGCEIFESTNVATSGSSPNTKYDVYVVGKNVIGAVDLAGRGVAALRGKVFWDEGTPLIKVHNFRNSSQVADPTGQIAAAVAFNIVFVAKLLRAGSDNYRFIIIEPDVSVAT